MVTRKELLPGHIAKFDHFHCDSTEDPEDDTDAGGMASGGGDDGMDGSGSGAPLTSGLSASADRKKKKNNTGGKRNITMDSLHIL